MLLVLLTAAVREPELVMQLLLLQLLLPRHIIAATAATASAVAAVCRVSEVRFGHVYACAYYVCYCAVGGAPMLELTAHVPV